MCKFMKTGTNSKWKKNKKISHLFFPKRLSCKDKFINPLLKETDKIWLDNGCTKTP